MTESTSGMPQLPWWILPGLAATVLVIFAGALGASCFLEDNTLRTQMFTGSYGLASLAAGFFFGSSAGSRAKDEKLAETAKDDKIAAAAVVRDDKLAAATVLRDDKISAAMGV